MVWLEFSVGLIIGSILGAIGLGYLLYKTSLLYDLISGEFYGLVDELPTYLKDNPEKLRGIVEPLLAAVLSQIGGEKEGRSKGLKIGGFKIPPEIIEMVLPMLMGQGKQFAANAAQNALG